MARITLEKVWKKYGKVEAVKGIDLECKDGEFLAILGPSGCGKTSTLRMIAGLEKVSAGRIRFNERIVNDLSPAERDVALAFEDYALYPALSVFDNIALPLKAPRRSHLFDPSQIERKVNEIAEMVDLKPILKRAVKNLSGGQQQRISLARALVRPASVFLLDEPLSHLDSRQRLELRANLKRKHLLEKNTLILVTHDQSEALSMADRIVLMNYGNIQQIGTPWEIYNRPANLLVANFIGDPPMNFLEAECRADRKKLVCHEFEFEMPDRIMQKVSKNGEIKNIPYQIGIRPNHFEVSKKDAPGFPIFGKVYVIEPLGDEIIITLSCNGTKIKAILPNDFKTEIDAMLWLKPQPDYLHVFDSITGMRF
ncbi:MAG: ABC transporter ATP-binding protein [Desulfobacterales bacterium]|nr:MAG: ABC transporter ATP-binding protein [Desulfobacterales bacterium]